ncbi:hypothetical protein HELRODRAFT_189133 [Helobdella robusta]|uniref:C2H2-type domain-containing protein n=1 Tax=Helobdella robusta TaxID=6412 RepID=T1FQP8_HELRO|nr:hypothetical protein HELRODRAFT_189133 [Helobdella robusta]ESN96162.1 hypothetical protein HELRODRAFT_189133 [Helobdella robusta]
MVESVQNIPAGELVSDYEVILPWTVIDTCCTLKPHGSSCFVSVNKQTNTSNQLFVSKLEDNSIKIRISVINLSEESSTATDSKSSNDKDGEEALDKKVELAETVVGDDDDKDVKESKEGLASESQNDVISGEQDQSMEACFNEGLSTVIIVKKVSPNKSQISEDVRQASEQSYKEQGVNHNSTKHSPAQRFKEMENHDDDENYSQSNDKKKVRKSFLNNDTNKSCNTKSDNKDSVTCELCFQSYESYAHLIRHVRKQHRDCTFVRNYLEEITPLLVTPCPVCKKQFTAKSSLDAHIKVSHGGQFASVPKLPLPSMLTSLSPASNRDHQRLTYAGRKNVKKVKNGSSSSNNNSILDKNPSYSSYPGSSNRSSLYSAEDSDDSEDESSDDDGKDKSKVKCDVCHESFDSRQQAIKHQDQVHRPQPNKLSKDNSGAQRSKEELFNCHYCSKKFRSKELVLKHCLSTHFRSLENSVKKKNSKLNDEDNDEHSDDDNSEEDDDDDNEDDDETFGVKSKKAKRQQRVRRKSDRANSKANKSNNSLADMNNSSTSLNNSSNTNSSPTGGGGFACDMCGVEFNRMTLLVTHARYCRQKIPQIKTYAKR